MKELGMHRSASKFVTRIQTADQKQQHVNICTELRQLASDDETFLSRVITGDLASCEFFLFPKMKLKLKGRLPDTNEVFQAKLQRALDTSRKRSKKWRRQWDCCLHVGGNYFKGDDG
jgi:hypothetical protein